MRLGYHTINTHIQTHTHTYTHSFNTNTYTHPPSFHPSLPLSLLSLSLLPVVIHRYRGQRDAQQTPARAASEKLLTSLFSNLMKSLKRFEMSHFRPVINRIDILRTLKTHSRTHHTHILARVREFFVCDCP